MTVTGTEKTYERNLQLPPFPEVGPGYLPDNTSVHFHFAPHATAEHFEEAAELLETTDIYVPESAGWDASILRDFNAISKGDRKIAAASKAVNDNDRYMSAVYDALLRTYKPVVLVDASSKQREYIFGGSEQLYRKSRGTSTEDHLEKLADAMSTVAWQAAMRDRVIVGNLGRETSALVSRHPRLAQKDAVTVLCTLGSGHEPVYSHLRSRPATADKVSISHWSGLDTTPENPEDFIIRSYISERAPTRTTLIRMATRLALGRSVLEDFAQDKSFYSAVALSSREPDAHYVLGVKVLDIMMEDAEQALDWAFKVNRLKVGVAASNESLQYLRSIAVKARELVPVGC
jgi:hypothetical protein